MKELIHKLGCFMREEDGVTALEYGLLAALISVMIIAGATLLGTRLETLFNGLADCFLSPPGGACTALAGA